MEETDGGIEVIQNDVGIDPLVTPASIIGSPLLSPIKGASNKIPIDSNILVDYKKSVASWAGITIICWLRFDDKELKPDRIPILVSKVLLVQICSR